MEQIKIDYKTFQELKAAIWDNDINIAAEIIENIELTYIKKAMLRAAYRNYKKTKDKEALREYIDLKNQPY